MIVLISQDQTFDRIFRQLRRVLADGWNGLCLRLTCVSTNHLFSRIGDAINHVVAKDLRQLNAVNSVLPEGRVKTVFHGQLHPFVLITAIIGEVTAKDLTGDR